MNRASDECSIGELAARFGVATHVLRYWESEGLLQPRRMADGQRRYGPADLERVALILLAKEAGFGIAQLRTLTSTGNPMQHTELLRRHVAQLERRIEQATAAKELIEHAMSCPEPFDQCPHARQLIASRIPPP